MRIMFDFQFMINYMCRENFIRLITIICSNYVCIAYVSENLTNDKHRHLKFSIYFPREVIFKIESKNEPISFVVFSFFSNSVNTICKQ